MYDLQDVALVATGTYFVGVGVWVLAWMPLPLKDVPSWRWWLGRPVAPLLAVGAMFLGMFNQHH